jgi:hypothetical protein
MIKGIDNCRSARRIAGVSDRTSKGWAQASLRIFSDTASFSWITEQFGSVADTGGDAGEPGPGTSARRSTLWVLKSGLPDEHPLDDHIPQLLGRLEARHAALAAVARTVAWRSSPGPSPTTVTAISTSISPWTSIQPNRQGPEAHNTDHLSVIRTCRDPDDCVGRC